MAQEKQTLREIILEGIIKFGGEIVGVVLIACFLAAFPSLRSLFTDYVLPEKTESQTELQSELEKHRQEEERLKAELRQREAALKEAEAKKAEEERKRAELQRQLEAQKAEEARRKAEAEKPKRPAMSDAEFVKLCRARDTVKVAEAIRNGANVNAKNKDGRTALFWAVLYDRTEIVRVLLQNGANVNAKDNNGDTALMWATGFGHTETADLLRSYGAKE